MVSPAYSRLSPVPDPDADAIHPPANLECEQAILGALLIQNDAYGKVVESLAAEHFWTPLHGRIYSAIGRLVEAGQPANAVTLKTIFDQDAALIERGGAQYLARLAESAVTIINVPFYAETIRDLHLRRELIAIGQDIVADSYRETLDDPVASQIERAEERLLAIADRGRTKTAASLSDAAHAALAIADAAFRGTTRGIRTGLDGLDLSIGGFYAGDFDIIGGRPSMGKSSLLNTIVLVALADRRPVHVFSGEMTAAQLAARLMAAQTGISGGRQRRGDLQLGDWDRLIDSQQSFAGLPCVIDDGPLSLSRIRLQAMATRRRQGTELVLIDHLQLMQGGTEGSGENRNIEIGRISNGLVRLAKELDIAVVALSQLSRRVEDRDDKRPMMADLRSAGEIEQDASVVILLYRHAYYLAKSAPQQRERESEIDFRERHARWSNALEDCRNDVEFIVAKNRNDRPSTVKARFDGARSIFYDPAEI